MSAFVVSDEHISTLVRAALRGRSPDMRVWHENESHPVDFTNAEEWAQRLKAENQRSVHARYPDTIEDRENTPGVIGEAGEPWAGRIGTVTSILGASLLPDDVPRPEPVAILKAIDCYEYQACEHEGWRSSLAFAFCQTLRSKMISQLPGYEVAQWEIAS